MFNITKKQKERNKYKIEFFKYMKMVELLMTEKKLNIFFLNKIYPNRIYVMKVNFSYNEENDYYLLFIDKESYGSIELKYKNFLHKIFNRSRMSLIVRCGEISFSKFIANNKSFQLKELVYNLEKELIHL